MATVKGQLGAIAVTGDGTLMSVYRVPASKEASVQVTIANRANTDTNLRVAHIKAGVVGDVAVEDYLLYDVNTGDFISNFAPATLPRFLMAENDTLAVYSSASAVSAQVNGIEGDVT